MASSAWSTGELRLGLQLLPARVPEGAERFAALVLHTELGRELQQALRVDSILQSVSVMLKTLIAKDSSAFATGTEPAPSKSI